MMYQHMIDKTESDLKRRSMNHRMKMIPTGYINKTVVML